MLDAEAPPFVAEIVVLSAKVKDSFWIILGAAVSEVDEPQRPAGDDRLKTMFFPVELSPHPSVKDVTK